MSWVIREVSGDQGSSGMFELNQKWTVLLEDLEDMTEHLNMGLTDLSKYI